MGQDSTETCEIHAEWGALIGRYKCGKIAPKEYVEQALKILNEHKEELREHLRNSQKQAAEK